MMPGKTINLHGRGPTVGFLVDVASTLRRHVLSCVSNERFLRPTAEELLEDVGELTGNFMERAQAWHRIHVPRRAVALGHAGGAMLTTFDIDDQRRRTCELAEARTRMADLQETLAAAIRRCGALAAEGGSPGQDVASLGADLAKARLDLEQILAATVPPPPPSMPPSARVNR
jgi:hypothetical protein